MTAALAYESVRIRTIRSTWWLLAVALVLSGLVALGIALSTRSEPLEDDVVGVALTGGSAFSPLPFVALCMALVGIFAVGHEYRHDTIRPTLTAVPNRSALVVAKVALVAVYSVAAALLSMLLCWLVVAIVRAEALGPGDLQPLLGYLAFVVLWGVLGVALALLLRSIPFAIVLILVIPLLVEPIVTGLSASFDALDWLLPATPYFPFTSGARLPQSVVLSAEEQGPLPDPLSRWAGGAVFTMYVAAVLAAAWALFEKRDA